VEVPDSANLHITNAITIMAWVKLAGTQADYTAIADKDYSKEFHFGFRSDRLLRIVINGQTVGYGATAVPIGSWQQVAFTYDGTTPTKVYLNGQYDTSYAISAGAPISSNYDVAIGRRSNPAYNGYFNGTIDEVRIYNRALTAEEIRESYQGYSVDEGLILYLPFDGDTKDYSGMGNDGTNYGAVSIDAPDVYVVTGGLEPGRTVAISEAVRVSGPHGKYVVGNRYSITVSAVYVDGSESAATTTVICR
jgi:hypothetical protein